MRASKQKLGQAEKRETRERGTHLAARSHPAVPGQPSRADEILHLQHTIGNRAIQRMLQREPEELIGKFSASEAVGKSGDSDGSIHKKSPGSPQIALSPDKSSSPALKSPGHSPSKSQSLTNIQLGWNQYNEAVVVKRVVGSTGGYDDRYQAIAVARLGGAEPAVVAQAASGKWLALETTGYFQTGTVSTDPNAPESTDKNIPFTAVYSLPSSSGIPYWRQRVELLKKKLVALETLKSEGGDPKAIEQEEDQVKGELSQAQMNYAKYVLGLDEKEIKFNPYSSDREAGKVNITAQPDKRSPGGSHGPVAGQGGVDFTPDRITAFDIDLPQLDDPARAQSILFHEPSHLRDYKFAQQWVKNYINETGRIYVSGSPGVKPFKDWLQTQVAKKRLSTGDVELIIDETLDVTARTEARANVRTFLAALQAGVPDRANKLLVAYAKQLKPGGQYGSPPTPDPFLTELTQEIKTAYQQMTKPMQKQYDQAVDAAIQENPGAWITALNFTKKASR